MNKNNYVELSIDALCPEAKAKINKDFDKAREDIILRPHILKPRYVVVKIGIAPRPIGDGKTQPRVSCNSDAKLPPDAGIEMVGFMKQGKIVLDRSNYEEPFQMKITEENE